MSASSRVIVIALMIGGILVLVVSLCITAMVRRQDITPGALFWAGSDTAAHPERYIRPEMLGAVRFLNLLGVGLFVTGALIMAVDAIARLF